MRTRQILKGQNSNHLNVAGTGFPGGSKLKNFILLSQLVFKLERFESRIGFSVFWLGNPYHAIDCPQNFLKGCSIRSPSKFLSYSNFGPW